MYKRILVLKGFSRYNVLRLAADEMIDAFLYLGYDVTEADIADGDYVNTFRTAFEQQYDLIFSFQALYLDLRLKDNASSFMASLNTPVFAHIVDHPIYHSLRLAPSQGDTIHLGCIDHNHYQYIRKYYPHIKNVYYLTHGGFTPITDIPYEDRYFEVYFPSSYSKPETSIIKMEALPAVYCNLAKQLTDQMLKNPLLTLQVALDQYFERINFECSSEEFTEIMNLMSPVDQYIRSYTRDQLLRSILDHGIHITVSGDGWEEFIPDEHHNLSILSNEGLDIRDTLSIMGNSKMVLNHIPTLQNGMHERIFSTMRCGSISITNNYPIVSEEFVNHKNILLYEQCDLQSLAESIIYYLNNTDKAKALAEEGRKTADAAHTWYHNAKKILEIAGLDHESYN